MINEPKIMSECECCGRLVNDHYVICDRQKNGYCAMFRIKARLDQIEIEERRNKNVKI